MQPQTAKACACTMMVHLSQLMMRRRWRRISSLGAKLQLSLITLDEADRLYMSEASQLNTLMAKADVKIRDPHQIRDLLSYQLISGVTNGDDLDRGGGA